MSGDNTRRVIIDTDIGSDIDDSWAIAFLLKLHLLSTKGFTEDADHKILTSQGVLHQPNVEVQMILSCTGNAKYRSELIAQLLKSANLQKQIPIGFGAIDERNPNLSHPNPLIAMCSHDFFDSYDGIHYEDGIRQAVSIIMSNKDYQTNPIILLSLGPTTNIDKMLEMEPDIKDRVHLIGMYGSFVLGYRGKVGPHAEYNAKYDVKASRRVFDTKWNKFTIVPLDTCGVFTLSGKPFKKISGMREDDPIINTLLSQYEHWLIERRKKDVQNFFSDINCDKQSTILYDLVTAYVAVRESFLTFQPLSDLTISDEGITSAKYEGDDTLRATLKWRDMNGFRDYVTTVLTMKTKA
ncbi:uridine nucleosidase [Acrasis kona]|uniref:Uridine nucleosidase n=1 Tax=Acrasis kona TaxID=1008807 RepID=A0AAW2YLB6_9EUKA